MITQNFKNVLYKGLKGTNNPTLKTTDGTEVVSTSNYNEIFSTFDTTKVPDTPTGYTKTGFSIGAGTTPESEADYDLDDRMDLTDFEILSASTSQSAGISSILTFTQTWRYTGSQTITINEIGLFSHAYANSSYQVILMAREVLDSPITVNNGDTFTVSMVIG